MVQGVPAQPAADLALLTAHRSDLVADRLRMTNRLRAVLTGVFPALERSFDYSNHKGALVLLTGYPPLAERQYAMAGAACSTALPTTPPTNAAKTNLAFKSLKYSAKHFS